MIPLSPAQRRALLHLAAHGGRALVGVGPLHVATTRVLAARGLVDTPLCERCGGRPHRGSVARVTAAGRRAVA